jgi:hypothetical protein
MVSGVSMKILITGVIGGVSYGMDEKEHVFLLDAATGKPTAQIEGAVAEQVRKTFALAEKYEPPKP